MRGILLIAHGDRTGDSLKQMQVLAQMVQEKSGAPVRYCFLQFTRPSVAEGLEEMRGENIDVLVAVPVFLGGGVHVRDSIPNALGLSAGEARGVFVLANGKEVPLVYAKPIGADPELAQLLLSRADAAVSLF
ncbi:MAG TPA: sirohydrochlorin nickelochelatase [Methanocorpusculum sp.]|nr:sirohydrochlorin nickelochelatase [Methanocorpusculum sp.]